MAIEVEYVTQTENLTDEFYSDFIDPGKFHNYKMLIQNQDYII